MPKISVECTCTVCQSRFTETNYFKRRADGLEWANWAKTHMMCPQCTRVDVGRVNSGTVHANDLWFLGSWNDRDYAYSLLRNITPESLNCARQELIKLDEDVVAEVMRITGDSREDIVQSYFKQKGLFAEYAALTCVEADEVIKLLAPKGIVYDVTGLFNISEEEKRFGIPRVVHYGMKDGEILPPAEDESVANLPTCEGCGTHIYPQDAEKSMTNYGKKLCRHCIWKMLDKKADHGRQLSLLDNPDIFAEDEERTGERV